MTTTPSANAAAAEMPRSRRIILRGLKTANKTVDVIVDIIVIIILLIGLYFLVDTIWVYLHSRADVLMPYKPVDGDMSVLKDLSEDCIGWITLDDTSIDYPIMQGEDNYEYLNKDPYGDYSLSGSIFLDARNASDFSDDYSLVYGHHMSGGYMFGALDDFEDGQYFEDHPTGTLYTERGILPIRVVSFLYTDANNELVFNPFDEEEEDGSVKKAVGDADDIEKFIKEKAINYTEVAGEEIVALTTCKSPTSTRRACLFVWIVDDDSSSGEAVTLEDLQQLSDEAGKPKGTEDE